VALVFRPPVRWLERHGVRPYISAALVVVLLFGVLAAGAYTVSMSATTWLADARTSLRDVGTKLKALTEPVAKAQRELEGMGAELGGLGAATQPVAAAEPPADAEDEDDDERWIDQGRRENGEAEQDPPAAPATVRVDQGPSITSVVLNYSQSVLFGLAMTVGVVFFLVGSGDSFLRKFVELQPRLHDKKAAVFAMRRLEHQVGVYLATQTLINLGLGLALWLQFELMGLPNAWFWGLTVGVLNYIPYLGPTMGAVLVAVAAVLVFDLPYALLPPAAVVWSNIVEANVVTPIVQGKRLRLSAAVVFLWIVVWGWIWGLMGVLLAVPMLVVVKIFCEHIERLRPVAARPARAADARPGRVRRRRQAAAIRPSRPARCG